MRHYLLLLVSFFIVLSPAAAEEQGSAKPADQMPYAGDKKSFDPAPVDVVPEVKPVLPDPDMVIVRTEALNGENGQVIGTTTYYSDGTSTTIYTNVAEDIEKLSEDAEVVESTTTYNPDGSIRRGR